MRFLIQRVLNASVTVGNKEISRINKGVCVLVGIYKNDTIKDGKRLINKLLGMRLWPDNQGNPWKTSIKDNNYEILFVSQFTLYARMKGTKPDYSHAMSPNDAKILYNEFKELSYKLYDKNKIFDGEFGAKMKVNINNDGPVTIMLNTDDIHQNNDKKPDSNKTRKKEAKKQQKIININNNDNSNTDQSKCVQLIDSVLQRLNDL